MFGAGPHVARTLNAKFVVRWRVELGGGGSENFNISFPHFSVHMVIKYAQKLVNLDRSGKLEQCRVDAVFSCTANALISDSEI